MASDANQLTVQTSLKNCDAHYLPGTVPHLAG